MPDPVTKPQSSETTQLRRPPRKRNPEESRRRILDAAESAFARRGYDGARLRDIAQDAGVHHALVHHYYGDKRGLFQEVLQRGLDRVSDAARDSLTTGDDTTAIIGGVVGAVFDFFASNRDLLRIIEGAFRDRASVSFEVAAGALGQLALPLVSRVRETIADQQRAGNLRQDVPPEAMVLAAFSMVVYPFLMGSGLAAALGLARDSDEAARRQAKANIIKLTIGALKG